MKKKQNKKGDTISQLKKEEEKIKKEIKKEEEEDNSEEEEDENNKDVVKQQAVQKADKPKNLKELMSSMGGDNNKQKPKKKETKPKNKNYEEPGKHNFVNTKGTANAHIIDNEAKQKKVFKNVQNLDAAAKENKNIKPTKDYLEKDTQKKYKDTNEEVAKPQFTTNIKEGEDHFVELNKDEDVRNIFFIL